MHGWSSRRLHARAILYSALTGVRVCVRRTALGGAWESGHSDREQYNAIYFEGTWVQELDNVNVRPGADFAPQRGSSRLVPGHAAWGTD
jgi:hypothetical protein